MAFPKDFKWGAASSAYQTEGAFDADGKGRSIWDDFCCIQGAIAGEDTGEVSSDTYHRWPEDVALMKRIGLKSYRFSVSWSRILPLGRGTVNERGFAFYDALVDSLLENGIEPILTLFHWDLPVALHERGGWLSRETAYAFEEYSKLIARHFDGRVKNYIPINEPECIVSLGYERGLHAPGYKLPLTDQFKCIHNVLLATGLSIRALRENSSGPVQIATATTGRLCYPENDTPALCEAAQRSTFVLSGPDWLFSHHLFLDPTLLGCYPQSDIPGLAAFASGVSQADWEIIRQRVDYIGLNIYNGRPVDAQGDDIQKYAGFPRTAMKWPVTPEVLRFGPRWIYNRYKLPVMIAENGQSCNDRIFLDGQVHDADRIDFLHRYLKALSAALDDGVPVLGYLHWCLTDNFEWHNGYDERFGLIYVDYRTQRRLLKDSARWYADVIKNNGAHL